MNDQKLLHPVSGIKLIGVILMTMLFVGCSALTPAPGSEVSSAAFTPTSPTRTSTSEVLTPTATSLPPTATPTPVPPTVTPTPPLPTSTPTVHAMNEEVCDESLCLTVTGAGDLGSKFLLNAPEGFHFLGVAVQVENLMDEPLSYNDFAEDISIRSGEDTGGFVTFFSGDTMFFPPFHDEFDVDQTENIGLLFAVADGSTEFSLIHTSLPSIALEIEETQ